MGGVDRWPPIQAHEIGVGVCTHVRPCNYLCGTLEQLRAAGLPVSVVSAEGDNYGNWLAMAHKLLRTTTCTWIMTTEDDIEMVPNAIDWIAEHYKPQPTDGFVSLYTSGRYRRFLQGKPSGIYPLLDTLWGACCLLWHRDTLRMVMGYLRHDRPNNVDGAISRAVQGLRLRQLFCLPSLVEHVGAVSSLGDRPYNEHRRAIKPNWKL